MKGRTRIFYASFLPCLIVLTALTSVVQAQEYPSRLIEIVIARPPGGASDSFFRLIREPLSQRLKVPISIVNRPGGDGVVGCSFVANSRADGYTLQGEELTTFLMPQIVRPKEVPYHVMKDFTPIAFCVEDVSLLVVRPDLEIKTFEDLISYAKKNPGKLLAGTSGLGAINRLNLEILKSSAGIDIHNLSFSGGGEVITNLLGGHVDVGPAVPLMGVISHIKAGKMRPLAALSAERRPELPDVPTTKEKGFPEVNVNGRLFLFGPKGLSVEITEKLALAVRDVLALPEISADLKRRGYIINFMMPKQLSEQMSRDFSFYGEIAKKAKLIQE
jgi:tripartite-type tricarboxylate transporter receptor subunit TctC